MPWNLNLSILPHPGKHVRVQVLCRVGRAPLVRFFSPSLLSDEYLIPLSPVKFKCCVLIMGLPSKSSQMEVSNADRSGVRLRNGVQTANLSRHYNAVGPTWNLFPFSWACFLQKAWIVSGFIPPRLQFNQCFMCVCFCILMPTNLLSQSSEIL